MFFARESRFWPSHVHLLRSSRHPSWRFYNLDGIARDSHLSVLIAHRPPDDPNGEPPQAWTLAAQQVERMTNDEMMQAAMEPLFDMFGTDAPEARQQRDKLWAKGNQLEDEQSHRYDVDELDSSEMPLSPGTDDERENIAARRQPAHAKKSSERTKREKAAILPTDQEWLHRPVVMPLHVEVTRWGQDAFALGAYSYGG